MLQGTSAVVIFTKVALAEEMMCELSNQLDAAACCFVWPITDSSSASRKAHDIACFNRDRVIEFCGHGLLASAAVIVEHKASSLPFIIYSRGKKYGVSDDSDGRLWLTTSRVAWQSVSQSPVMNCFNVAAMRSAIVGEETGYLILEWPAGFDLAELSVDLDLLSSLTRRAVIATSRAREEGDVFYLRYFAPQYGQPEDRVTGSAATVLASYWGCQNARFEQRSFEGGEILARLDAETTSISGNISVQPYR